MSIFQEKPFFRVVHPKIPEYRFEYHPGVKKLYLVAINGGPEIGELVAENVRDNMHAQELVKSWGAGYLRRKGETAFGNTPSKVNGVPTMELV